MSKYCSNVDTTGYNRYSKDTSFLIQEYIGAYVNKNMEKPLKIKKVVYNGPATIVFWTDNTKTVVRCLENEPFDAEKGLSMACAKKLLGNKGSYYDNFKKWIPKDMAQRTLRAAEINPLSAIAKWLGNTINEE